MQFQYPHLGHAACDGRARDIGRVGRIPHRVRAPPYVLRSAGQGKRLHLLKGLEAILLDIDKAVRIVRETKRKPRWCQPDDRLRHRQGAGRVCG